MKKLDIKYYLLIFIETFSIWQMGIIFYSSKTLTINNLLKTPITINNSILIVIIGYIIGILLIYLWPKKTILFGKISMLSSLLASIILFLPISSPTFLFCYYLLTFNCVFFISINTSLIINYYSLKTALIDAILGTIVISFFIAICQNNIIPLSFSAFNILATICLFLITLALFKLPTDYKINFIFKETYQKVSKKMIFGLFFTQIIGCLSTLFTASIAETLPSGVSISYLGGLISGIIFLLLYKLKKISPFKILPYIYAFISIGFALYLLPIKNLQYIAIFLQGFSFLAIMLAPFLISHLFEIYPSKAIAPATVFCALLTVIINAILLEVLRNNSTLLYSIYAFISLLAILSFLLIQQNLELQFYNKDYFYGLTPREKEVANLIIKGYSTNKIATTLFLSEYTVKDYTKSIYKKYDVHSKFELIQKFTNK